MTSAVLVNGKRRLTLPLARDLGTEAAPIFDGEAKTSRHLPCVTCKQLLKKLAEADRLGLILHAPFDHLTSLLDQ